MCKAGQLLGIRDMQERSIYLPTIEGQLDHVKEM